MTSSSSTCGVDSCERSTYDRGLSTGFLGRTLCPYLANCGYRLRALVRPSSAWQYLRDLGVELAWGDIRDAEAVRAAASECGTVVHAAGKFRFWGQQ
ncbi:MAG: NAD-dependent epimerase/dehydratase family protein, partial [Armatimonadota bacterium]|nr:NAD-dependent epimerase/dehydratase family protein [Armatimonadota bacterium]